MRQHLDDMQEARDEAKASLSQRGGGSSPARLEARADSLGRLALLEELLSAHRGAILLRNWVISMLLAWAYAIRYYWRYGRGPQAEPGATTTALLWTIPIVLTGTLMGWNKSAIPRAREDGSDPPMPKNPLFAELLQQISEEQAFYMQQEAQMERRGSRRKRSGGGSGGGGGGGKSTRRTRSDARGVGADRSARKRRSSGRRRRSDFSERSGRRRGDTDDDDDEDEKDDGDSSSAALQSSYHRQASLPAVLRRNHLDMDDESEEEEDYRDEPATRQSYHRQSSLPTVVLRRRRRRSDRRDRSPDGDGDREATESLAPTTKPMTTAGAMVRGISWLLALVPLTIMSLVKGYVRLVFAWLVYWPVSMFCYYLPAMVISRVLGRGNEAKNKKND